MKDLVVDLLSKQKNITLTITTHTSVSVLFNRLHIGVFYLVFYIQVMVQLGAQTTPLLSNVCSICWKGNEVMIVIIEKRLYSAVSQTHW